MITERPRQQKTIKHPLFDLKIATLNRKYPSVIYVKGETFIVPLTHKQFYKKDIEYFNKCLKNTVTAVIRKNHKDIFTENCICRVSAKDKSFKINDASTLKLEFHLKQKNDELPLSLPEIKNIVEDSVCFIMNEFMDDVIGCDYEIKSKKKKNRVSMD